MADHCRGASSMESECGAQMFDEGICRESSQRFTLWESLMNFAYPLPFLSASCSSLVTSQSMIAAKSTLRWQFLSRCRYLLRLLLLDPNVDRWTRWDESCSRAVKRANETIERSAGGFGRSNERDRTSQRVNTWKAESHAGKGKKHRYRASRDYRHCQQF